VLLACSLLLQFLPAPASEASRQELRSLIALTPAVSAPNHRPVARERQRTFDADTAASPRIASARIERAPGATRATSRAPRVVDPSPYDAQAPPRL
jgi:hypothetical protein